MKSFYRQVVLAVAFALVNLFVICSLALIHMMSEPVASIILPLFSDVSVPAGLADAESGTSSSLSVADLDQNGYVDMVLSHHDRRDLELFYGSSSGFKKTTLFTQHVDHHGAATGDFDADGMVDVLITTGGGDAEQPSTPLMAKTMPDGSMAAIEPLQAGLDARPMHGLAARFVDLDGDGRLDIFLLGRPAQPGAPHHAVYQNLGNSSFALRADTGLELYPATGFLVTDFDGDYRPDIFLLGPGLKLFQGDGNFRFTDVSDQNLPSKYQRAFSGAVELDYDNDGDFDVYFAAGSKTPTEFKVANDLLLENRDGVFVDVTAQAKVPKGGYHVGISAADFNNDGNVDIFIPREGPTSERLLDLILINDGNGTFMPFEDHSATDLDSPGSISGVQAFDFNRDGKIDVAVAGGKFPAHGPIKLFKNITPLSGNYLTVDLPVNNEAGHTSMDALVTVKAGGQTFVRRSGSVGEFKTQSFIDSVHFGLGNLKKVDEVDVRLTSGMVYSRTTIAMVNGEVRVGDRTLHE